MLKPRYRTIGESVSDFRNLLEDMNTTQPVEHSSYDALDSLIREEQDLERLEREIEHVENVLNGLGLEVSEADLRSLGKSYLEASNRFERGAEAAARRARHAKKRGENPALQARFKEVERRLRRKGQEYKDKQEEINGSAESHATAMAESRDPAINSRYRSQGSALERFRVLAGIEEQTAMPRDAGIFGSTRHNANYDEMAEGRSKRQQDAGLQRTYQKATGSNALSGRSSAREKIAYDSGSSNTKDPKKKHSRATGAMWKAGAREKLGGPRKSGVALRAIDDLRSMGPEGRAAHKKRLKSQSRPNLPESYGIDEVDDLETQLDKAMRSGFAKDAKARKKAKDRRKAKEISGIARKTLQSPKQKTESDEYQEGEGSRRRKSQRQSDHFNRSRGSKTAREMTPVVKRAFRKADSKKVQDVKKAYGASDAAGVAKKLAAPSSLQKKDHRRSMSYGKRDRLADRSELQKKQGSKWDEHEKTRGGWTSKSKYAAGRNISPNWRRSKK